MRPSDIPITICVLCYGEHPELARRCLDSIIQKCPPEKYLLRVGLNECCPETVDYVRSLEQVDSIYLCRRKINQCFSTPPFGKYFNKRLTNGRSD